MTNEIMELWTELAMLRARNGNTEDITVTLGFNLFQHYKLYFASMRLSLYTSTEELAYISSLTEITFNTPACRIIFKKGLFYITPDFNPDINNYVGLSGNDPIVDEQIGNRQAYVISRDGTYNVNMGNGQSFVRYFNRGDVVDYVCEITRI